ncbi:MAG: MBL fold metallo-hydrolase, partial [Clostridia bacterium]
KGVYVIDAGEENSGLLDYLLYRGVSTVQGLFLSHPHRDHVGGLADLLEEGIRIQRIYLPAGEKAKDVDSQAIALLERAMAEGIAIETLWEGRTLSLSDAIEAQVLWPPRTFTAREANQGSLVLRIAVGPFSLLCTGDVDAKVEPLHDVQCDALQVSHHGSADATGAAFMREARPRVAMISVGGYNRYGHPGAEVIDRLAQAGAAIYRTDQNGAVCIRFWNDRMEVRPTIRGEERP